MKLYYIHWADEECCPRRALSLYQSCPDYIKQVHDCEKALSHPENVKRLGDVMDAMFVKSLKKVYKNKNEDLDVDNGNWWTGKYSLLAGFFASEEDAKEAIKIYVERRNKSNEEARRHEREFNPGRYTEKELHQVYTDVEEKDFAVGFIDMPCRRGCTGKIQRIEPKKHCGNCRFRIVEHDLERREPLGCLFHLDEQFYDPMAQVCDLWAPARQSSGKK